MQTQQMQDATLQAINDALIAAGWTLNRYANEDDGNFAEEASWTGEHTLTTAGDGQYECNAGEQVKITNIAVFVHSGWHASYSINIEHEYEEDDNTLYTDKGIESGMSKLLGVEVQFTEAGMQDEFYMSME
jgi:hypothetical protein